MEKREKGKDEILGKLAPKVPLSVIPVFPLSRFSPLHRVSCFRRLERYQLPTYRKLQSYSRIQCRQRADGLSSDHDPQPAGGH
jgi:hypothetical protein